MSKIRIANLSDDVRITAVINAAFKIAEGFFVDGNRISREEVRQHMESGFFLVAENEDGITGCVYLELRNERGARFMDIYIVNLRAELPAFYAKRGYVENGTTPFPADVPTKQPCHFINMFKSL